MTPPKPPPPDFYINTYVGGEAQPKNEPLLGFFSNFFAGVETGGGLHKHFSKATLKFGTF